MSGSTQHTSGLLWSLTDLLRGSFKPSEYGSVVLPLTLLQRLDSLLAATRQDVLDALTTVSGVSNERRERRLTSITGQTFYNTSRVDLAAVAGDYHAEQTMLDYVDGFSANIGEVLERFGFRSTIARLQQEGVLNRAVGVILSVDLGPSVSHHETELILDQLVRWSGERAGERFGEYATPPDLADLMVRLLLAPDTQRLTTAPGPFTILDPVCGAGRILHEASDQVAGVNPDVRLLQYGQDVNPYSWSVARCAMLLRGDTSGSIVLADALRNDAYPEISFDYLVAAPPFGLNWKRAEREVRYEHEALAPAGRFGAGVPRSSDASLLFVQHLLAKMKPIDPQGGGGSRIAVLLNAAPMHSGDAGSGESRIRQWIIENDWLETIVALPDQLCYHTGIATYLWILSNRKPVERRGRVVLLNARESWERQRRSTGDKRKYISPGQLDDLVRLYDAALTIGTEHKRIRIVRNEELAQRQLVIERPLRLRFEFTSDSLDRIVELRSLRRDEPAEIRAALQGLVGSRWSAKSDLFTAVRRAAEVGGVSWPRGVTFERSVRDAVAVRDDDGEIQEFRGGLEPDPDRREHVAVPLDVDPGQYLSSEVHPSAPDAWLDDNRTRVGYRISPSLFVVTEFDGPVEPLSTFVRLATERAKLHRSARSDQDVPDGLKFLAAQDLQVAESAAELPDAPERGVPLTQCTSGDVVGRPGSWRLLPDGFGDAVTPLLVLRPVAGAGRVLCEWLNAQKPDERIMPLPDLLRQPVPVDLVDNEINDLLEDIHEGRRSLRATTSGILPNVFGGSIKTIDGLRAEVRFAAQEARLVSELVRPIDDPVWRAEWSYPFHVAALARRYRLTAHPAEQIDALLKVGEGLARTLGLLALSELVAQEGVSKELRRQFRSGATFGTWTRLTQRFLSNGVPPRIGALGNLRAAGGPLPLLEEVREFRNRTHHAHGVRANHQLDEEVRDLEPLVVEAIRSLSWLSGADWRWVERCEYLDERSFKVVGLGLRGSHPSWEPFDQPSQYPLKPDRVYVDGSPSGTPIDLWPLAAVAVCPECRARELFLLNQIRGEQFILRSLEEHTFEIDEEPADA